MTRADREYFRIQIDGIGNAPFEIRSEHGALCLDEMVLGKTGWLHLERMSPNSWWMQVGNRAMWISVDRNGTAKITMEEER